MRKKSAPEEPDRLPVKLGPTTNGEYFPERVSADVRRVQRLTLERAHEHARRLGVPRREFLRSACGTATMLLTMNQVLGCGGGGSYAVDRETTLNPDAAKAALGGDELIFDVQTHHVATDRPWAEDNEVMRFLEDTRQGRCARTPR